MMEERRKGPTPGMSKYCLFGRRKGFTSDTHGGKGGYVDRYSQKLFIVLVGILVLNVLDVILTMVILDHQGVELNPLVRSAIEIYGNSFWVWKYGIVSVCLVLLCLHINFKGVKTIVLATFTLYVAVVIYQIFLITFRLPLSF
jgi:hypothetical protein